MVELDIKEKVYLIHISKLRLAKLYSERRYKITKRNYVQDVKDLEEKILMINTIIKKLKN